MLPCYLVLDVETTGGSAVGDRVTEIAAVRVEAGVETARWSSLLNPGVPIAYFVQQLTGIDDAMVADAPSFKSVADTLLGLLDGAVLVAHNAAFDHGMLKSEFARLGHELRVPTLCTVRLSRRLYPQFKSHSLDAVMQRHGLHTSARHRAMGDVDMVLAWLQQARSELGIEALRDAAQDLLTLPLGLPAQLETSMDDIPDSPGVYLCFGDAPRPLFVGSASNLRTRVMRQLQSQSKDSRERKVINDTRRVEWQVTAGEIGAMLLAKRLVSELEPVCNRRPKAGPPPSLQALHPWPHKGLVGLREHDAGTDRTDLHIFHQWCHVATAHDANDLAELVADAAGITPESFAERFDMDLYRILQKKLLKPSGNLPDVIRF